MALHAEHYTALTATAAADLLIPPVEASGGQLVEAVREDVVYRPSREATVRFAASVRRAGTVAREGWVLHALADASVTAWRVREDPQLPGLRRALNRETAAGLLADLGFTHEDLELRLLTYRPMRRAVVRATSRDRSVFLKCVRPSSAAALRRRHHALSAAGLPTPTCIGYDEELGLLVLSSLPGEPMRRGLLRDDLPVPPPAQVLGLLPQIGGAELDLPARDPMRQAAGHAALLRTVLPGAADRLDGLLGLIDPTRPATAAQQVVHGDLYDAQVLVGDGRIVGLVDVDGAGRGHPEDDVASLLAHLHVLTTLASPTAVVHSWLPELTALLPGPFDPAELRRRTGAVLLGLCTWPHSRRTSGWEQQTRQLLDLTARVLAG